MIKLEKEQKEFNKDISDLITLNKLLKQHCTNFAFMQDGAILMQSNLTGVRKFALLKDSSALSCFHNFYFKTDELVSLGKAFKKSKNYGKMNYSSKINELIFSVYDEEDKEYFSVNRFHTNESLLLLSKRTYKTLSGKIIDNIGDIELLDYVSIDPAIFDDLTDKKLCCLGVTNKYYSQLWFNKNILATLNKTKVLEYACISESIVEEDLFVEVVFRQRLLEESIPLDIYTFVGYVYHIEA